MIHYHGLPITPLTSATKAVDAGHAFVSFAHPEQLDLAQHITQSYAVDNGAFPAWRNGRPITDWRPYYHWASGCQKTPNCDFAVVPDVIDGDERSNDDLLDEWPLGKFFGAPVWHMHESLDRLDRLVHNWNRVCIGSSGDFSVVGNADWWRRIHQAMRIACDEHGRPHCRLHGLRMLNPAVFTQLPFASADSTNIGRNVGIDKAWKGTYLPANKDIRALVMRTRIESHNGAPVWHDPLF